MNVDWTLRQERVVRRLYGLADDETVAARCGRPVASVRRKAWDLFGTQHKPTINRLRGYVFPGGAVAPAQAEPPAPGPDAPPCRAAGAAS